MTFNFSNLLWKKRATSSSRLLKMIMNFYVCSKKVRLDSWVLVRLNSEYKMTYDLPAIRWREWAMVRNSAAVRVGVRRARGGRAGHAGGARLRRPALVGRAPRRHARRRLRAVRRAAQRARQVPPLALTHAPYTHMYTYLPTVWGKTLICRNY